MSDTNHPSITPEQRRAAQKQRQPRRQPRRKIRQSRLMRWLLRIGCFAVVLVLVAALAIGALLHNPQWLSSLLQRELAKQGITADIQQITAVWSKSDYRLQTVFTARADNYGVDIRHAEVSAAADLSAIFDRQRPLFPLLRIRQADIAIDRRKLLEQLRQRPKKQGDLSAYLNRYLPQYWQVAKTTVAIEQHSLSVSAIGHQHHIASVTVHDSDNGELRANYRQASHTLTVQSKQLDLAPFTGQDAKLQNLYAEFDLKHWINNRIRTELDYQGLTAKLQIEAVADTQTTNTSPTTVRIRATSGGHSLSAWVKRTNEGAVVRFQQADLSALTAMTPLLPQQLRLQQLSGMADGTVQYTRGKGITAADIALHNAAATHHFGGFSQLSGVIRYADQDIHYALELADSHIALPMVYPDGLAPLSGSLSGHFETKKRRLLLKKTQLHSTDIGSVSVLGQLNFDKRQLDLQVIAENLDLSQRKRLLPKTMPPKTRAWLMSALLSGKKNHTTLTMRGYWQRFLHRDDSVLQVQSQFEDTVFHYLKNNPDIQVRQGTLTIDGRQLSVDLPKATIKGVPVVGSATVEDFLHAVVRVNARIRQQPVSRLLPIAAKSIAAKSIATVKKILTAKGKLSLDLALILNIADKKKPDTFDIHITADKATVTLNDYPALPVKQTQLSVLVNENGLQQVDAKGKHEQSPVAVTIRRDRKKNYLIHVDTKATVSKILPKLKLFSKQQAALLRKYHLVAGQSDYQADIRIDNHGELQQVEVSSPLVGTSINAFSLLTKSAKSTLPLTLTYTPTSGELVANLKNQLQLTLAIAKNGQIRGLLVDNSNKKRHYKNGDIQMYWQAKRFDLVNFNAFRSAYAATQTNKQKTPTYRYRLAVDLAAVVFGKDITLPLKLQGNNDNLKVTSPLLSGTMHYRPNHFDAEFEQVEVSQLFHLAKKTEINPEGREVTVIDLAKTLPQMRIHIDKVIYKGNNVGNASIATSIRDGRYSIDQIFVQGKNYYFEASGYEAAEPQGIATHLALDFKAEKIQDIIALFQLNPFLDAKFIDISANMAWPGKAHTLNLRQSYGKARLAAQNVKISEVSTGVGGVFGLMDIGSILKRISLDFKNLSSSKLSFDTIDGHWNIGGGRAMTRDAYATGSLVELKVVGAVDLHRRIFDDIDMTVIPKASNIIPVVGAVSGGFVGAVVGIVIQQVAGDTMNEAVGLPYVISGEWQKPIVTFGSEPPESPPEQAVPQATEKPTIILESLQ